VWQCILPDVIGDGFGDVLAAAQAGNDDAFATLWRDTNPALLRYLRLVGGAAAEDLAADTWLSVVRGLRTFRGDESAWRGWVFTIARRRNVDETRRRVRQPTGTQMTDEDAPTEPDSADVALQNLDTHAALRLVATLPPLQAEVIVLRVVAGLPVAAVAKMVHRSPGAVRVAAHRGMRTLERMLTEAGVTL
jgi:RNA polymerase sigma-70 factor, ECF subfamily